MMRHCLVLSLTLALLGCSSENISRSADVAKAIQAFTSTTTNARLLSSINAAANALIRNPCDNIEMVPDPKITCTEDANECANNNRYKVNCTLQEEVSKTCGTDTYTMNNGAFSVTISLTDANTVTFSVSYNLDLSGGSLGTTPEKLLCNIDYVLRRPTRTSTTITLDCSNVSSFSCTLGGTSLTCAELYEAFSANSCSSS